MSVDSAVSGRQISEEIGRGPEAIRRELLADRCRRGVVAGDGVEAGEGEGF
jgi:IS30 family transposase